MHIFLFISLNIPELGHVLQLMSFYCHGLCSSCNIVIIALTKLFCLIFFFTYVQKLSMIKYVQISLKELFSILSGNESSSLSGCIFLYPAAAAAKSLQSCPTLCDPRDGSPPGFPIPGILQARTLEWVAISFSNA